MTTQLLRTQLLRILALLLVLGGVPPVRAQSNHPVMVNTQGRLLAPLAFWSANSNSLNTMLADPRGRAAAHALPDLWVYERDGLLWLRWPFDSTTDALLSLKRANLNGVMNFDTYYLVPASTAAGVHQWAGCNTIADDLCPAGLYNAGYVGANHGWFLPQLTAPGHSLGPADLGKTWSSGTNTFALYRIPDSNTVVLLPKPCPYGAVASNSIYWLAYALAPTGALAPVSAVAPLVYSARAFVADSPAGRVLLNSFLLDGQPLAGQMARGRQLTVSCVTEFPDALAAFAYATNHPGQSFSIASNLPAWFTRSQVFRFYPWGQIDLEEHLAVQTNSLAFFEGNGPLQAQRINPNPYYSATNLWLWMPGISNAWSSPALNHGVSSDISLGAAQRFNPARPARFWVQWAAPGPGLDGAAFLWGTAMGYETLWNSADSWRASQAVDTYISGSTRKLYPCAAFGKTLAAPGSLHFRAWRSFFGPVGGGFLCRCLRKLDQGWACFIAWNTPGAAVASLPPWLDGLYCGTADAEGGALLSTRVAGGVELARSNAVGWIDLWIK